MKIKINRIECEEFKKDYIEILRNYGYSCEKEQFEEYVSTTNYIEIDKLEDLFAIVSKLEMQLIISDDHITIMDDYLY